MSYYQSISANTKQSIADCITDPFGSGNKQLHHKQNKCKRKQHHRYRPISHLFNQQLYKNKQQARDILPFHKQILQIRYNLISDPKYCPQKHYSHLIHQHQYQQSDSCHIQQQQLQTLLPQLPPKLHNFEQLLKKQCLVIAVKVLNQEIVIVKQQQYQMKIDHNKDNSNANKNDKLNNTHLNNSHNKYLILTTHSPSWFTSSNINNRDSIGLSLNGYMNLIKQWGQHRTILDSQCNKTINYRSLYSTALNTHRGYNGNSKKKKQKQMTKFDDLVGLLLFYNCLLIAQLLPSISNAYKYLTQTSNSYYLGGNDIYGIHCIDNKHKNTPLQAKDIVNDAQINSNANNTAHHGGGSISKRKPIFSRVHSQNNLKPASHYHYQHSCKIQPIQLQPKQPVFNNQYNNYNRESGDNGGLLACCGNVCNNSNNNSSNNNSSNRNNSNNNNSIDGRPKIFHSDRSFYRHNSANTKHNPITNTNNNKNMKYDDYQISALQPYINSNNSKSNSNPIQWLQLINNANVQHYLRQRWFGQHEYQQQHRKFMINNMAYNGSNNTLQKIEGQTYS